ncbi:acyltransferase [bacterium]|nr:acyltransferase [bacterium]
MGKNSVVCYGAEIRAPWKIEIGENTIIGNHATLDGRGELLIGNNVNISSEVSIWTVQHKVNCPDFSSEKGKVIVNDYVWLSTRCIILPGAEIGRGGIVAAGAVVTKNIPPNVIVGGVPANKIGKRVIKPNYILKSRRHFY